MPNGSGLRTEHMKPTFFTDELTWSLFHESIATLRMPHEQRRYFTQLMLILLLKKDADGKYSKRSKRRPIGAGCATQRDSNRGAGSQVAKQVGKLCVRFGQFSVSIKSGGEVVQAEQARTMGLWLTDSDDALVQYLLKEDERGERLL